MTILEAAERSLEKWIPYSKGEESPITNGQCGMCDYHYGESKPCPLAMEAHKCDCQDLKEHVCIDLFNEWGNATVWNDKIARKAALEIVTLLEAIRDRELAKETNNA